MGPWGLLCFLWMLRSKEVSWETSVIGYANFAASSLFSLGNRMLLGARGPGLGSPCLKVYLPYSCVLHHVQVHPGYQPSVSEQQHRQPFPAFLHLPQTSSSLSISMEPGQEASLMSFQDDFTRTLPSQEARLESSLERRLARPWALDFSQLSPSPYL